jgi:hypothetical protein
MRYFDLVRYLSSPTLNPRPKPRILTTPTLFRGHHAHLFKQAMFWLTEKVLMDCFYLDQSIDTIQSVWMDTYQANSKRLLLV